MTDLGSLHYFLGLEINQSSQGLFITQTKYASDLLHKFNMYDCKPSPTPLPSSTKLTCNDGQPLTDPTPFRQAVGALQYLTFTRPDLAYSVNHVCQFMHCPTDAHLSAVKRILLYLKGTISQGLLYQAGSMQLSAFCDADWASDPIDRRSVTGFVAFLGSNPIHWGAKKQPTVARSSTEAEYRALATTAAELTWLQMLLCDLHMFLPTVPTLWCDNMSAVSLASNPLFHARTKHIEIDYHYVREKVNNKQLVVAFVSSEDQTADIFTKSLASVRFQLLKSKLMVVPQPISLRGRDNHLSKHPIAMSAHVL